MHNGKSISALSKAEEDSGVIRPQERLRDVMSLVRKNETPLQNDTHTVFEHKAAMQPQEASRH